MSNSCDPTDWSPPGSSVHMIFQARILERVVISSSRGCSQLRDWTCVPCIGRRILYCWATKTNGNTDPVALRRVFEFEVQYLSKGITLRLMGEKNCLTREKDANSTARDGQVVWPWPCHLYWVSSTITWVGAKGLSVGGAENWVSAECLGAAPSKLSLTKAAERVL